MITMLKWVTVPDFARGNRFIVGDINAEEMGSPKFGKEVFKDVKAPVNPAERIYYPVADNQEPLIYIGTDKEVANPSINIFFKQDATPDSLQKYDFLLCYTVRTQHGYQYAE